MIQNNTISQIKVEMPKVFYGLFEPGYRYKVYHGGRGRGASWSFARALAIKGYQKPLRILCAREYQNSIKDSVHQLLSDQITLLGLDGFYRVKNDCIVGNNGTIFIYAGLHHNIEEIKSKEGIDICWIEEGEKVTDDSLNVLIPTIRKDNSEIWILFNDGTEYDPVYQRFVTTVRMDTIVKHSTYKDNPWFPETLRLEMEWDKAHDYQKYEHIWLGKPTGYAGRIFQTYDSNVHVIRNNPVYDISKGFLSKCNCYMSIDPHKKYYPFITWIAVTPAGKVIVYNEFPTRRCMGGKYYDEIRNTTPLDISPEQLAGIILTMDCGMYGAKIKARFVDPHYVAENPEYLPELSRFGVGNWQLPPFESIETGRNKLRELMSYNKALGIITGYNEPEFGVLEHCENVDRALGHHAWDEKDKKATGDGVENERYKDPCDTLRYFLGVCDCKYKPDPKPVDNSETFDGRIDSDDFKKMMRKAALV